MKIAWASLSRRNEVGLPLHRTGHKKKTMSEKFVEGVKPLQQFMDDGSFLMLDISAIFRAMQALRAPEYVDYDYLLSVSGMAVRLAWQQGWAGFTGLPNKSVFYSADGKDVIDVAFGCVGVTSTRKKVSDVGIKTAEADIKTSIDKGAPVVVFGVSPALTTILGYRDSELYGVSTWLDPSKRIAPHQYNRIDDWKNIINEYILINDYKPKAMDRVLFTDTLKRAVYLARTTRLDCLRDTALGISAFDAVAEMMVWDESFEPLEPGKQYEGEIVFPYDRPEEYYRRDGARTLDDRFWSGYCDFLCMLNGYGNFARFLDKYADLLPERNGHVKEAVKYYCRACDYSGELWKYVTPDAAGVAKFKEKDVRYVFAAHMVRAKIYTIKAVEILERLIHQ